MIKVKESKTTIGDIGNHTVQQTHPCSVHMGLVVYFTILKFMFGDKTAQSNIVCMVMLFCYVAQLILTRVLKHRDKRFIVA